MSWAYCSRTDLLLDDITAVHDLRAPGALELLVLSTRPGRIWNCPCSR
ncbi:hypothetical protein [Streptomyces sp. KL116D]